MPRVYNWCPLCCQKCYRRFAMSHIYIYELETNLLQAPNNLWHNNVFFCPQRLHPKNTEISADTGMNVQNRWCWYPNHKVYRHATFQPKMKRCIFNVTEAADDMYLQFWPWKSNRMRCFEWKWMSLLFRANSPMNDNSTHYNYKSLTSHTKGKLRNEDCQHAVVHGSTNPTFPISILWTECWRPRI